MSKVRTQVQCTRFASGLRDETAPLFRRPHEDRTRPMVRNAKTQRQRSGKAPGKPRGRYAQKRSATEAPQGEPSHKKFKSPPAFGAAFMLFRVLCCASVVGAIYATPNIEGLLPDFLVHDMTAVDMAVLVAVQATRRIHCSTPIFSFPCASRAPLQV